jgi:pyrroline-5-carboxylate reductase
MPYELGIIGAGNMAEAIVRGVLRGGVLQPSQIIAADVMPARRELFSNELGVQSVEENLEVARQSKAILLSVKPQQMQTALSGMSKVMDIGTLVISIAAGISSRYIEQNLNFGRPWRVIRTMPNTPMLVGEGMVAMSAGTHATQDDLAHARRIFEAAATVIEVPETQIDAVTAVSGSGPAYLFFLVEQMISAGINLGLSPEHAKLLAAKTAAGAAKMLVTSTDTPQELRRKVTSPGGTTQAAIAHLESQSWPTVTIDAIKAAAKRSKELGV